MNMKLKLFIAIVLLHSMSLIKSAESSLLAAQQTQPIVQTQMNLDIMPAPAAPVVAQQPQPIVQQPAAVAIEQPEDCSCVRCCEDCFMLGSYKLFCEILDSAVCPVVPCRCVAAIFSRCY